MREYKDIYTDYCNWIVKKTGKPELSYANLKKQYDTRTVNMFLYRDLLRKVYDKKNGIYYFCKFVIGDLKEIGYPSDFRYNKLLHDWNKLLTENKSLAVLCARGHGKEIADSTPILTVDGWKTHGDLVVGNSVFGINGKPIKVLDISTKNQDDYLVKTRNGESIRCHENHEWTVFDAKSRTTKTLETKEMFNNTKWLKTKSRFFLPNIKPLKFEKKELPIDPYYLGLWLGDGCSTSTTITHNKYDVESVDSISYKKSRQWIHKDTGVITTSFAHNNILKNLQKLNLIDNKHIPDIYINSSIEQRLELVAGLIDSDGSVSQSKKSNKIRFTNTNKQLINGLMTILTSLGLRPYVTTQKPKEGHLIRNNIVQGKLLVYTIGFVSNIKIHMRLPRKQHKLVKLNRIAITDVSYEPTGERGNCITVDSDDGLYLVGKNLIPTHNSVFFSQVYNIYDMFLHKFRRVILVSASQDQAEELLTNMKMIIEHNEMLNTKKDPTRWAQRRIGYNGGYALAVGIGSEILGQHVDRIVLDDILRSDNKMSDKDIEDYIDMNLDPMLLNRRGQMVLVGTPKSESDIFEAIKRRKREENECPWVLKEYPAVLNYEKRTLQCPDRFTWAEIMAKRLKMGPLKFAREYQLQFFSRELSLFPKMIVDPAKDKGKDMILLEKADKRDPTWTFVTAVDVARSGAVSADFTVAITLAYNSHTQVKQLVHIWRAKGLKIKDQAIKISEILKKFNNCMVLVEQNNMGQDMIDSLVDDHNCYVESFVTGGKGQKKEELIRFLIKAFEFEQIIIPQGDEQTRELLRPLLEELDRFCTTTTPAGNEKFEGVGAHDDTVMSLALVNKATQIGGTPFAITNFNGGNGYSGTTKETNPYGALVKNNKGETDLVNMIKMGLIK